VAVLANTVGRQRGDGGEIQFNGFPTAFTKEPLMLTLDTQGTRIDDLNVTLCVPRQGKGTLDGR
jgi:hypothetical protein